LSREPLVIRLRPAKRWHWAVIACFPIGGIALVVLGRDSWTSVLIGAAVTALGLWIWLTVLSTHNVGRSVEIVATDQGISSPLWSISWDAVARVYVRHTRYGPLLSIETRRPQDLRLKGNRVLEFNAFLSRLIRSPAISLPLQSLDRPVDELLGELELRAGRPLG
jgi:hypothetical protein